MRNILVVKLADIGDVLTATPALRALRQSHPAARITALVTPGSADVLRGLPYLDALVLFDKFRYDRPWDALRPRSLAAGWGFFRDLCRADYDTVVILHHLTTRWGAAKYAALALASGALIRAGLDNGRGWFLTHRQRDQGFGALHEVDYWLEVVGLLGAHTTDRRLELAVGQAERGWAATVLRTAEGESPPAHIAIHPGSGSHILSRRWPPERYAALADALAQRYGARIVLVGGRGEENVARQVASQMHHPVMNLAGQTHIKQLAAVLERCMLFVGGDSGVMHVAVASGTPVVALFGPTNERAWGPYVPPGSDRRAMVVRAPATAPCMYVGYRVGDRAAESGRAAIEAITPQMVLAAAEEVTNLPQAQEPAGG